MKGLRSPSISDARKNNGQRPVTSSLACCGQNYWHIITRIQIICVNENLLLACIFIVVRYEKYSQTHVWCPHYVCTCDTDGQNWLQIRQHKPIWVSAYIYIVITNQWTTLIKILQQWVQWNGSNIVFKSL